MTILILLSVLGQTFEEIKSEEREWVFNGVVIKAEFKGFSNNRVLLKAGKDFLLVKPTELSADDVKYYRDVARQRIVKPAVDPYLQEYRIRRYQWRSAQRRYTQQRGYNALRRALGRQRNDFQRFYNLRRRGY